MWNTAILGKNYKKVT